MNLGIPWSCGSAPSQEIEQICHLLSPKLIWSRARKRNDTLALLTEAELVETLMYLHLPPVVGRLLVNQVL